MKIEKKSPEESFTESRYLVMPEHANHYGTAFGGVILSWIDLVGAMTAERHCGHEAVTVSMDQISFLSPIHVGDHVHLTACVTYTGTTSMEIEVNVIKENPYTNVKKQCTHAYLTFVGLDKNKKPKSVPPLLLKNEDVKKKFLQAQNRARNRKKQS